MLILNYFKIKENYSYRGYAGSKNGGDRTLGGTTILLAVGMY